MFGRATIRLGIGPHSSFIGAALRLFCILLHQSAKLITTQRQINDRIRDRVVSGRPPRMAADGLQTLCGGQLLLYGGTKTTC